MTSQEVGPVASCRCGHDEDAHEHYREGTECSLCGCRAFEQPAGRPPISPELRRLLAVVLGVPLAVVVIAAITSIAGGDAVPIAVAGLLSVIGGVSAWWLIRPRPHDHDEER